MQNISIVLDVSPAFERAVGHLAKALGNKLDLILRNQEIAMARFDEEMQRANAASARLTTVVASVKDQNTRIIALLRANKNDPAAIGALADAMERNSDAGAAAVAEMTAAADEFEAGTTPPEPA